DFSRYSNPNADFHKILFYFMRNAPNLQQVRFCTRTRADLQKFLQDAAVSCSSFATMMHLTKIQLSTYDDKLIRTFDISAGILNSAEICRQMHNCGYIVTLVTSNKR